MQPAKASHVWVMRPSTRMKEKDLITQFKKGKQSAFEELYNLHSPKIFSICLRYAKNGPDAEDLLHDIFVKLFENREKFDTKYNHFYPWAKQVAINHIITTLGRRIHFTDNVTDHLESPEEVHDSSLEFLDFLDKPENVLALLQQMPDGYRAVFNMYVFEGLDHQAIADSLGIATGTSKSQLARARQFLKKELLLLQTNLALKAS